jgi:RimJ/RimL family protein N-acetyltransferase
MPEFGWILAPAAHCKGYAKEAARAAIAWAEEKFPATTFCCIIDNANAPSIGVAQSLGFRRVDLATYKGFEIGVFHRAPSA